MGGLGVCQCLGFVSTAAACCFLSLLRFNVGNPIRLFRTGLFLRINICCLLLHRCLAGKLEMPSMRAGLFPGGSLSKPAVWRALFPLWSSQMVRLRDRRSYFPTQVPLWAGSDRSAKSFAMLPRPMEKAVASMLGVAPLIALVVMAVAGAFGVVTFGRGNRPPRGFRR